MLALTLDIMIVALLLISLGAGLRLHNALKIFRVDRNEFQPMIQSLDKATIRAENALGRLRKMAEDVSTSLSDEGKNAQRLVNELDFMTKRADQLAERLDDRISKSRSMERKSAAHKAGAPKSAMAGSTRTMPSQPKIADDIDLTVKPPRRRVPDLEQRLKNLR